MSFFVKTIIIFHLSYSHSLCIVKAFLLVVQIFFIEIPCSLSIVKSCSGGKINSANSISSSSRCGLGGTGNEEMSGRKKNKHWPEKWVLVSHTASYFLTCTANMFYLKDYLTLRVLDFLKNKYEKKKITKTKKKNKTIFLHRLCLS